MKDNCSIIQTISLNKNYVRGNEIVHALKDCTVNIQAGEFITIMGASGSGKTTLLNILGGLDTLTSGEYILEGVNVTKYKEKKWTILRRKLFGYVFQSFYLIPTLSVFENVELPLLFSKKKISDEYIDSVLTAVGIIHRKEHLPSQLSGGEMQRTAIARALVQKPKILIIDEPTGNLDSKNANTIFQLFEELNQKNKITIVCATHDIELVKRSSRILKIKDGSLVK
jgi:putative ABC transport system ATP-binding protein